MDVIAMGAHVLDVLVRPVEGVPEGQGAQLVDEIRITAAGSAGGAAINLAKLGAQVRSAGAVGRDAVGDMLVGQLQRFGVDTTLLVRRDDVTTSASVLPIRPNGERPAWHVIGANATYGPADVDRDAIAAATHVHLGAPELVAGGGEAAAEILAFARGHGVVTSADPLAPGELLALFGDGLRSVWPLLDHLLPNDEQALALTGTDDVVVAAETLRQWTGGCVAVTCGGDGVVVAPAGGGAVERVPAFAVDVVDTTGCGDAFSAGFLRGVALGRPPLDAAILGCAVAALVARGLGSDHGDFTLAAADAFAAT